MNELTVKILLEPLLKASRQGQLQWEDDPTGGAVVRLGSNTVNIYGRSEGQAITVRLMDGNKRVVDYADISLGDQWYNDAEDLLRMAMNKALRKDDIIQETLQTLALLP